MSNMKNKTAKLLRQIIAGLTLMTKSKTMALKSKVNAIKARLIIFSLMKNKKFLMSSISDKFHSIWGNHSHHHSKEDCLIEEGVNCDDHHRGMVIFNNNAHTYEALQNPSELAEVVDDQEQEDYYDDGDDKYPDLTHSLFDSEELNFGGSVIDRVKNCKEEAGKEFKLEDNIDEVADLFIRRFRRNIILQKQDSLKRKREIAQNGT